MKLKALDYKGKHFILQDENTEEDGMDFRLPYINTEFIVENDINLENHVAQCQYYGIPAYIGGDTDLHERIEKIYKSLK